MSLSKLRRSAIVAAMVLPAVSAIAGHAQASAPPAPAEPAEPADITFAIPSAVLGAKEEVAVISVAAELGFFEEENLTVETINVDGSTAAVQAIGAAQADIAAADAGSILAAVESDVPVTAIGGLVQNWPWRIATQPDSELTAPEDFAGKRIGVISLASGSAPYARAFVAAGGLDPETDVELIPVGVGSQAAAALTSGQVDALALYTQAYSAIESGGTELAYLDNPDVFSGIRSLTFVANTEALAENPGVYERFLRAAYKALLFSANNPEAALTLGYEHYPQILGGEDAESRFDADLASLQAWLDSATPTEGEPADFTDWGAIPDEDWERTNAYTVEAGQIAEPIAVEDVFDGSLLAAANDFDSAAIVAMANDWTAD